MAQIGRDLLNAMLVPDALVARLLAAVAEVKRKTRERYVTWHRSKYQYGKCGKCRSACATCGGTKRELRTATDDEADLSTEWLDSNSERSSYDGSGEDDDEEERCDYGTNAQYFPLCEALLNDVRQYAAKTLEEWFGREWLMDAL